MKTPYIPSVIPAEDLEVFRKGRMGGETGFGNRPAVIVVDMTRGFVEDSFPMGYGRTGVPCSQAIAQLLAEARQRHVPVFFTKGRPRTAVEEGSWQDKRLLLDTRDNPMNTAEAHEIVQLLEPTPDETIVVKDKPSAFFGTQLVSMLIYKGIDTLIVTGMVTSGCVRATVVDAFSYNYKVIVPVECVADRSTISHEVSLFDIDQKYGDVVPLARVLEYLNSPA